MKNYRTKIISNQEISPGYYRMRILAPGFGEKAHPGQFVMFRVQRSLPPPLRPPTATVCLPRSMSKSFTR